MDLLGSGGFTDPFYSPLTFNPFPPTSLKLGSHFVHMASSLRHSLGLFAVAPAIRINSLETFQNSMHLRSEQLGFLPNTYKLFGSWKFCIGCCGILTSWFDGVGKIPNNDPGGKDTMARFRDSNTGSSKGRKWTNILIGLNVLMFVVQEATHGKILLLGAKVNSLINQGEIWRFITPAFLHANLPHLLTNCYSLNSIGPIIEAQAGSARYLTVYLGSALAGFFMSYSFTRAPAVGASGAVFGLVGALAVFLLRHRDLMSGASQSLSSLARMIVINMLLGLSTSKIDNWGHLGGFLGGAVISWLVGPAFSYKRISGERKMVLVDRPPIFYILRRNEH